jgi:wobble nucleotide-excising tRNase
LSSGDRSALALAFFLASLKQNPNLSNMIVVLDDPFTSQDRFRQTCTQQLICELSKETKQVVVCSHDPYFLKSISESSQTETKVLKMVLSKTINEMDIVAETQSTYMKNYATLLLPWP